MSIRNVLVGAAMVAFSGATSVSAQGRAPQKIVLSPAAMKLMVARKPKSKTPLTAHMRMVRRSNVAAAPSGKAAPTSVRAVKPVER
jgi:hypothetical protein